MYVYLFRCSSGAFVCQVVEDSGWGWQLFSVRSVGAVGELYALQTLDYEDETHRRGFKFMVQVTDRVSSGHAEANCYQCRAWSPETLWIHVFATQIETKKIYW